MTGDQSLPPASISRTELRTVGAEAIGERAARRAGANDDEIEFFHDAPSRSGDRRCGFWVYFSTPCLPPSIEFLFNSSFQLFHNLQAGGEAVAQGSQVVSGRHEGNFETAREIAVGNA